jgi:tetratricopeptide (TPR) repeat protein
LQGEDYQSFLQQELERLKNKGGEIESLEEVDEKVQQWLADMDIRREKLETLRVQLGDHSLLQELSAGEYRLHPLIREFFILKLQESSESIDDWKRDLCRVMVAIAKQIPQTVTLGVIESCSSSIPHLREVGEKMVNWFADEDLIWPFAGLGWIYEAQSQFTEAEKWCKKSLQVTGDRLGEKHPDVASSYDNLALLYESMGKYEEALPLSQKALKINLDVLGERHPHVATAYNNLAVLYKRRRKYDKALPLSQKALEIRREQLGEKHLDTAQSYNNLAVLYESMGKYGEALPLHLKALEIRKEQLGEKHPDTAKSYNNLASVYQSMGRYEEALPLFQETLGISLEQLGERHPDVATFYNNLAGLYESMERYEEAIAHYLKALDIAQKTLGQEHPNTVMIANNYQQMLLESPIEEILKALPEEEREDHLQMRLEHIVLSVETVLNQLDSP